MTYIVNDNCIKCKLMDCMEVCPVDCFYEGENMLAIKPDECIDCGVCEPECPIDAIKADTEEGASNWVEHNTKHYFTNSMKKFLYKINLYTCKDSTLILRYHEA